MVSSLAKKVVEVGSEDAPSGCVGITTYLKNTLQRGRKFRVLHKPKSTAGKRGGGADAGLQIGRFTDLLFRRVVAKEVKLDGTKYTHRRCARIMRNLETLGIVPLRTQLSVTLPHHKITTQLDGVGINKKNELVVLEIKVRHGDAEHGWVLVCN